MKITTEKLLVSPMGFDLASASPVQLARARIGDGLPLGELAQDPDVQAMIGGPDALASLPSEFGIRPAMVVDLSSIRSAKTMIAVCRALLATQIVDVSGLKVGEVPRVILVSLKLSRARVAFRMLRALLSERPALRPLFIEIVGDSIFVRHPSGRPIEIACVATGRAAGGFVGDWCAGLIADEAPRMIGREEGVANLSDILSAIRGRLLPGAQMQLIGSPHAPSGPVYDLAMQHFGRPTADIVVLRSNGPQNNPGHFTPEFCRGLELQDPTAYQTDVLGNFSAPEVSLLNPEAVQRNVRQGQLEVPYVPGSYSAAIDPSDAQGGNGFTLVIIRLQKPPGQPRNYSVVLAREWRVGGPDHVLKEVALLCAKYHLRTAVCDGYSGASNVSLAKRYGLGLLVEHSSSAETVDRCTSLQTLIHEDLISLPPNATLIADLLGIRRRATANGFSIQYPRTQDGRHADYIPALLSALNALQIGETGFDREAINRRGEQVRAAHLGIKEPAWKQFPEESWNTITVKG